MSSLTLFFSLTGLSEDNLGDLISISASDPAPDQEESGCNRLVGHLIQLMHLCCQYNARIRLVTLEMSIMLLKKLVLRNGKSLLSDYKLASIEQAKEEAAHILRNYYKNEEEAIFLDVFEEEFAQVQKRVINVEYLMMDANLLLPPNQLTSLMMNGVDFTRRLPCEDVERLRYAIRTFFLIRNLSLVLRGEDESNHWALSHTESLVQVDQLLDLNNSDLIACTVINKESGKEVKTRRFMVIDSLQLILIEPDNKKLGFGVARFACLLQDVEVTPDKDDSRSLHLVIRDRAVEATGSSLRTHCRKVSLAAKFLFDDHIRCMAAKQRLTKGRMKARQRKMHLIARLIELGTSGFSAKRLAPHHLNKDMTRSHSQEGIYRKSRHSNQYPNHQYQSQTSSGNRRSSAHKPLHRTSIPGVSVPLTDLASPSTSSSHKSRHHHRRSSSSIDREAGAEVRPPSAASTSTSASASGATTESSMDRSIEEMIPMEDLSPKSTRRRMMALITGYGRSQSSSRVKNRSRTNTTESVETASLDEKSEAV